MADWDPSIPLDGRLIQAWINLHTKDIGTSELVASERFRHGTVPLGSGGQFRNLCQALHAEGYYEYVEDWDKLPVDRAGRRLLSPDMDSTQTPGVRGIARVTYRKDQPLQGETDVTGLLYELWPTDFDDAENQTVGWRSLPVAKVLQPERRKKGVLFHEGRARLDALEAAGAIIVELSGASERQGVPGKGWSFHEIMRRAVHEGIADYLRTGREKVLLFAIVREPTRKNVSKRMGHRNFVDIGKPVTPPGGGNVKGATQLTPCVILASEFLPRMVASYRERVANRKPTTTLREGIRFYTNGIDPSHLAHYPMMVELLAEIG